ncbi:hypothetical protein EV192_111168 [Actinocrispum wychmicini]|uniref:Uncharacterized protein n=1 Tax=Actinocrispum wychmicini TaxID=1213861 RepID=A0A4R2J4B9_9PSEU|nr:hypothetical protein EV192_111168 [Actinocrispum wychmicini]
MFLGLFPRRYAISDEELDRLLSELWALIPEEPNPHEDPSYQDWFIEQLTNGSNPTSPKR